MEEIYSFGYWVMRRRKALNLTQGGLAQRVSCSPATIKKIERDERRPSLQVAELLAVALAVAREEHALFLRVARGELPVDRLRRPFSDLREVLWEEEKGTWFSIRFTIDTPGTTQTEYNFEVDPVWDPSISPEVWAKDLEIFPRAEAWWPRWLRRQLNPGLELLPVEPGEPPQHVMYARHVGQQVKQTAPTGWTYAQVRFREIGDHVETTALVHDLTGRMFQWAPPPAVAERFREVRQSMAGPRTTWCTARLDVEYSGRENLTFNRMEEPKWITPPPPEAYQEELRRVGCIAALPDWLRARLDESAGG